MFELNKIILLLDGLDEISPEFNDFIIELLCALKNKTNIQFWVSTRPQHANQLMEKLEVKCYKFVPYTWEEKENLILNVLKKNGIVNVNERIEALRSFEIFFEFIKADSWRSNGIDCPFMLTAIAELYAEKSIDLNSESLNIYDIFKKLIDRQKKIVNPKVQFEDNKKFEENFSSREMLQVFALKLLFENDENCHKLKIFQKWEKEKQNFTPNGIQRYGIVHVTAKEDQELFIDFVHLSYAEFSVADFIIKFLLDSDFENPRDEEIEIFFDFIKKHFEEDEEEKRFSIFREHTKEENIRNFIESFAKNHSEKLNKVDQRIKKFVIRKLERIKYYIKDYIEYEYDERYKSYKFDDHFKVFKFYSSLILNEREALKGFWEIKKEKNFLQRILKFRDPFNLHGLFDMLEYSFGVDWHEVFDKSNLGLSLQCDEDEKSNYVKNFYKLCNLIKNNNWDTKICHSNDEFMRSDLNSNEHIAIVKAFSSLPNIDQDSLFSLFEFFIEFYNFEDDQSTLLKLLENLESILGSNEKNIKKILCIEYEYEFEDEDESYVKISSKIILDKVLILSDSKVFAVYKEIHEKYLSEDIKSFISDPLELFFQVTEENINQFVEILKQIYNFDNFQNLFESESESEAEVCLKLLENFQFFKEFVFKFFDENLIQTKNFIKKLFSPHKTEIFIQALKEQRKLNKIVKIFEKYEIPIECNDNDQNLKKIIIEIFKNVTNENFLDLKNFMLECAGSKKQRIKDCILLFDQDDKQGLFSSEILNFVEKFLLDIFEDSTEMKEVMQATLCTDISFDAFEKPTRFTIDEVSNIARIYAEYDMSQKIRHILNSKRLCRSLLLSLTDENYSSSLQFFKEFYAENVDVLLDAVDNNKFSEIILSKQKYEKFKNFISDLFENDFNQIKKVFRQILFRKYTYSNFYEHPIVCALKENSPDIFQHISEIYDEFKESDEELENIFESPEIIQKTLNKLLDDSYQKYQTFVLKKAECEQFDKFLTKFSTDQHKREFMRLILFKKHWNHLNPLIKVFQEENSTEVERVVALYDKYKNSDEELKNIFKNTFYLKITPYLKYFKNSKFQNYINKLFAKDKEIFLSQISPDELKSLIIKDETFEEFLLFIFDNDESRVHDWKRNKIFYENSLCLELLISALESNNLEEFLKLKEIYEKYKKSPKDLQNIFHPPESIPKLFYCLSSKVFDEFSKFLSKVFGSNKEQFIECIKINESNEEFWNLIISSGKIKFFEKFLKEFLSAEDTTKIMRMILFYNYEKKPKNNTFVNPLYEVIDNDSSLIEDVFNIYDEYKNSDEQIQEIFKIDEFFVKLSEYGTNIINYLVYKINKLALIAFTKKLFAKNKSKMFEIFNYKKILLISKKVKVFELFEDLIFSFFKYDENEIEKFFKNSLFCKLDAKNDFLFNNFSQDEIEKVTIMNKILILPKFIPKLLLKISDENYELLKNFLANLFEFDKEKFLECFSCESKEDEDCVRRLILNENEFKFFDKFLTDLFTNNNINGLDLKRECIRNILVKDYKYFWSILFYMFLEKYSDEFERIAKLYDEHKNSIEELQDMFMTDQLFRFILNRSEEIKIEHFVKFSKNIFENDKNKFLNFLNHDRLGKLFEKTEAFVFFEKFLRSFLVCSEENVKKYFTDVLFNSCESNDYSSLFEAVKSKSYNKFMSIIKIYLKYQKSPEDVQNIFINSKILLPIYLNMSNENYFDICETLTQVFDPKKENFLNCVSKCTEASVRKLIFFKENFNFFVKFTTSFLDEDQKRKCIRLLLFRKFKVMKVKVSDSHCDSSHILFDCLYLNYKKPFKRISKLYIDYKKSWTELQDIFIKNDNLLRLLQTQSIKNSSELKEFTKKVFKSNKKRFLECFKNATTFHASNLDDEVTFLENYFIDICGTDHLEEFRLITNRQSHNLD